MLFREQRVKDEFTVDLGDVKKTACQSLHFGTVPLHQLRLMTNCISFISQIVSLFSLPVSYIVGYIDRLCLYCIDRVS